MSSSSSSSVSAVPARPVQHSGLLALLDRCSYHYSYFSLPISSLNIFINGAGASYGIGYFAKSWEADLAISKTSLSIAWAIALLLTGAVTPFISPIIDKFGVRVLAYLIVLPSFAGLFLLSYTNGFATLLIALFIIRLFTSFMLINAQTITTYWWVNRKGYAVSITSSIGNLALVWPTLLSLLHHQAFNGDWRETIRVEAYILGVLGTVAAIFTLNQPEKYGRLPDGKVEGEEELPLEPIGTGISIPVKEKATAMTSEPINSDTAATEKTIELNQASNTVAPVNPSADSSSSASGLDSSTATPAESIVPSSAPFFIPSNAADSPTAAVDIPSSSEPAPASASASPSSPDVIMNIEVNWHWKDAISTVYFWSVNGSLFANYLLWGGFSFHFNPLFDESNIESTVGFDVSSYLFIPIAASVIISMMFVGRVFDRAQNKCRSMLLGVLMCQMALACILSFPSVADSGSKAGAYIILIFYSIVYGVMNSVQTIAFSVVLSFAFGRSHNGAIYGASTLLNQFSLALGPILFSLWKDGTGSYRGAIIMVQILSALAGIAIYLTPMPDPSKRKHKVVVEESKMDKEKTVRSGNEDAHVSQAEVPVSVPPNDQATFLSPEIVVEKELQLQAESQSEPDSQDVLPSNQSISS